MFVRGVEEQLMCISVECAIAGGVYEKCMQEKR